MNVITRFAPSPTGYLHIGNARTALINYLLTKKNNGNFILRIDDTDLDRSKEEYTKAIIEDLQWLGINWDSTFNQSNRIEIYKKYMQKLIKENKLYPCYETKEELEYKKKIQLAKGEPPIYDRSMLKLTNDQKLKYEKEGRRPYYRFQIDHSDIEWEDLVKGKVKFHGSNISDPVLIKENGIFLYSLCSVIDDIESKVTHIIRGEDHLTNTAMHIQLFKSLGGNIPKFGHMSLVSMIGGEELSKRSGSMSLRGLRDQGIHRLAILNYLFLLGQSEQETLNLSLEDMINSFDIEKYGKALVKFDLSKLDQINMIVLQGLKFEDVVEELERLSLNNIDEKLWNLYKHNIKNLKEITEYYNVLYGNINIKEKINKDFLKKAIDFLPNEFITEDDYNIWLSNISKSTKLKGKELFMSVRIALTGQKTGPHLKDIIIALGVNKIKNRLISLI